MWQTYVLYVVKKHGKVSSLFLNTMKINCLNTFFVATIPAVLLMSAISCQSAASCKYKPAPVFEAGLPHVTEYHFEKQGSQSLERLMLDTGVLLEINQEICNESRQEYRFNVKGNFSQFPDSLWLKEATRQLVFLSTFSPKQAAFKAWADVIELRRADMRLGEDREVEPGVFVRVDRILSPEESTLVLVFSQK